MIRRPRPTNQLPLDLNAPPLNVVIPDEAVRALADLLLEAAGARPGAEREEGGHEPQDHR